MCPSANTAVCPENNKVGNFIGNHAHSCGRYGFRIFHNMVPRKFPCKGVSYDWNIASANAKEKDKTKHKDPYKNNPAITAEFRDVTSWKNGRNGAIAERVGDVRFKNFKVADNILAGIEFSLTGEYGDDMAQIDGALIIGKSTNVTPEDRLNRASPRGIITPRTENFRVKNVKFYNLNWNNASGIGSCSHCFHNAATDSGARTVTFEKLWWDDETVPRRIRYQLPWRAIYHDLDGTLTGKGPDSWATFYYKHHEQPGCDIEIEKFNGVVCDKTGRIRRLAFHGLAPSWRFRNQGLRILRFDDAFMATQNKEEYIKERKNYSSMPFKEKSSPSNGWAIPFVIGHKYKIHWGNVGLDFDKLTIDMS